eukprot:m.666762 g.666762  ORF g.666762 m.666762 type:complete len:237 (-) comp58505_c0_seq3:48-758(-)
MFGVVNNSIEQVVRTLLGESALDTIRASLQGGERLYLPLADYPLEVTIQLFDLAVSASKRFSALEWTNVVGYVIAKFCQSSEYRVLLTGIASRFEGFVSKLGVVQQQLQLAAPDTKLPDLTITYDPALMQHSIAFRSESQFVANLAASTLTGFFCNPIFFRAMDFVRYRGDFPRECHLIGRPLKSPCSFLFRLVCVGPRWILFSHARFRWTSVSCDGWICCVFCDSYLSIRIAFAA